MMRPAFATIGQAAGFAMLLLILLSLPEIVGNKMLLSREQVYAIPGWGSGPYPWIRNQIFEEKGDIDIVFVGSSHIFNAIYTPYVQEQLSKHLGRPALVRTLAWGGAGYDALYYIVRDLLSQRRVKELVFYDENPSASIRNNQLPCWVRWNEDQKALAGLPFREKALFYFASLIAMPRNLLSLLRENIPAPLVTVKPNYWTTIADSPNPATQLGCLTDRKGYAEVLGKTAAPFEEFSPPSNPGTGSVVIYSADAPSKTQILFRFDSNPLPSWQEHFVRRLGELLRENGVTPVMLNLPAVAEARKTTLEERAYWPDLIPEVKLIGIPPAALFGSLSDAEVLKVFNDPQHLNKNGQTYFTRLISPTIIELGKFNGNGTHQK